MTSYTERLHLKLTVRQLFDLVADVGRYPEFVPWVVAFEIVPHEGQSPWVDMTVGTSLLRKKIFYRGAVGSAATHRYQQYRSIVRAL